MALHKQATLTAPSGRHPATLFGIVVQRFFRLEAASGILLLAAAVASLIWANVSLETYQRVFGLQIAAGAGGLGFTFTLRELVNDGLMTIFFFVVGMEIKRELLFGELRTLGQAALPGVAALGGIAVPAAIYFAFNPRGASLEGWAIPMATDIAFSLGVLTLLKTRVPQALLVFLTALAIFDDIAGILVIAVFYGHGLQVLWLGAAALVTALLFLGGREAVTHAAFYAILGGALWYALHHSGIHATISGVVLGLAIPGRLPHQARDVLRELTDHTSRLLENSADEGVEVAQVSMIEDRLEQLASPLARFVSRMHPLVAFGIMPAFALANAGIPLQGMTSSDLVSGVTLGAALGLLLGKPLGIFTLTFVAIRGGLAPNPAGESWTKLFGVSVIAGIGFTVAIFIAALAFPDFPRLLTEAKLGIILGSLAAGVIGAVILVATPSLKARVP
jgi:NhaA family Na+:H+ antiporter